MKWRGGVANLPIANLPIANLPVANLPVASLPVATLPVASQPVAKLKTRWPPSCLSRFAILWLWVSYTLYKYKISRYLLYFFLIYVSLNPIFKIIFKVFFNHFIILSLYMQLHSVTFSVFRSFLYFFSTKTSSGWCKTVAWNLHGVNRKSTKMCFCFKIM